MDALDRYKEHHELKPQEALAKPETYEREQVIKVGDVVTAYVGRVTGVVVYKEKNVSHIMWNDGSTGRWKDDKLKQTGRHIDIINALKLLGVNDNGG